MLARRSVLFALAAVPVAAHATAVLAVDALPDSRFVGFCQTVNDFEIASGRLALAKSTNELIRGYASRMVDEHTEAAQYLVKARAEAGVSYAPDPSNPPNTVAIIQRLNSLTGPEFDTAYANAQLAIQTQAHDQYGAYSQNGDNGALRRYAQRMQPKSVEYLEYARRIAAGR